VELIAGAKNNENRSTPVMTDIGALERAVEDVLGMLERVSDYVSKVIVSSSDNDVSDIILTNMCRRVMHRLPLPSESS
jgi:translation initiation factor 3 subunit F